MDFRQETRAHHAMAAVGGFFGVYALLVRGGTFGSSETSNLIYLVVSGLDGTWGSALVRLGARRATSRASSWRCCSGGPGGWRGSAGGPWALT